MQRPGYEELFEWLGDIPDEQLRRIWRGSFEKHRTTNDPRFSTMMGFIEMEQSRRGQHDPIDCRCDEKGDE
uniref:Uncharacterized protein n=1 Tax=Candidatus Kentrum sp. LFY TaxID=2126342 RepID=A0A450X6R0_9GAMM|nr:MAG: hypothetical protein BECKLFY1418C_GA0070996_12063 [Candidatus Kentron sp. LFY]